MLLEFKSACIQEQEQEQEIPITAALRLRPRRRQLCSDLPSFLLPGCVAGPVTRPVGGWRKLTHHEGQDWTSLGWKV